MRWFAVAACVLVLAGCAQDPEPEGWSFSAEGRTVTEADYLEAVAPLLDRGASEADVEANGRAFCDTARRYGAPATFAEQVASLQDVIGLSDVEATRVASAMLVRFCPDLAD